MTVTPFYFAYGSNMNPARVEARGLHVEAVCGGVLDGVRLTFDKQSRDHAGCGHASLAFDRSARTEGVLYRLRSDDDIRAMDRYEATPVNYSREIVVVNAGSARRLAWTYFANPAVVGRGLRPERSYLEHLLAGRPYLTAAYFDRLRRVQCIDD